MFARVLVSGTILRDGAGMTTAVRQVLTILAVESVTASAAFYEAAFGWPRAVDTPVYVELTMMNGQRLGLYERHGFGRNVGRVPAAIPEGELAPTELYFYADDLDAAIDRLRHAGAHELGPLSPRDWGDEVAYFADPSGNVLAIARPRPAAATVVGERGAR